MRSALMAMVAAGVLASTASMAQTYSVIWNFPAGSYPIADLHLDPATGTLYGATQGPGYGTVFSLKERRETWKSHTLLTFGGTDGQNPYSGLIEDSSGNLYGTTSGGGASDEGMVFELSPSGSSWNETVLYSFKAGSDGALPESDLIMDKTTGAIFGTTSQGGAAGCGTAFELTQSGGTWSETVIYAFQGGYDGCNPQTRLREDSQGNLWGVTFYGGERDLGTVFELMKTADNGWREVRVHTFRGPGDGEYPTDLDLNLKTGTLYGTTYYGGYFGKGVIFQLTEQSGHWRYKVVHHFSGESDGSNPVGLHLDLASNTLYGTTQYGGSDNAGTVFQLVRSGHPWVFTLLHSFGGSGDGSFPAARATVDPNTGYLYGTTEYGGTYNGGTAWMIIP